LGRLATVREHNPDPSQILHLRPLTAAYRVSGQEVAPPTRRVELSGSTPACFARGGMAEPTPRTPQSYFAGVQRRACA